MTQVKRNHKAKSDDSRGGSLRWVGLVLVVIAAGVWIWQSVGKEYAAGTPKVQPIDPPTIVTTGVDPAVVKAIDVATQQVTETPESDAAWGSLAMVLAAHEFNEQAGICYSQAAALNPTDARWPYLHARTLLLTAPDNAVPLLEQSVTLCGNTPTAPRLTLVETLLELYRLDEADEQLLLFEADYRADPRARLARARLAFLRNDIEGCLEQLKSLSTYLQTQPKFRGRLQPLLLMMAECFRRQGDIEQSEKMRNQGLAQGTPAWPDPYQKLVRDRKTGLKALLVAADLAFGKQDYERSIATLEAAIRSYPDSIWARILLGRALIRTGAPDSKRPDRVERLARAQAVLEKVLEMDSNSVEAMFRLAVAKGYANDPEGAVELYKKAVQLKPDFTMAHYNLALNYRVKNDLDAAVQSMEQAIMAEPDFVIGHAQLGDMLMRLNRYDESIEHLQLAVKLNPRDRRFRQLLVRAQQLKANQSGL